MKVVTAPLLILLVSVPGWAAYQYYFTGNFTGIDTSKWTVAGVISPSQYGLAGGDANGGSAISRIPIPDGSSEGEVRMTVILTNSGGTYTEFLQGSPDARTGSAAAGSYLAFEMQNPIFAGGHCSANFVILQSLAGSVSLLASFPHSCRSGMTMRMAIHNGVLLVWPDQDAALEFALGRSGAATGQPGIGARGTPAGNAISQVQLGAADRVAPAALDSRSIGVVAFRRRVDVQWKPVSDDPAGSGMAGYWIYRDGEYLMRTTNTFFSDEAVTPGDKHTYTIYAVDQHYNFSAGSSVTATVPVPVKGSGEAPPSPSPIRK